jgi:hypothetical protein
LEATAAAWAIAEAAGLTAVGMDGDWDGPGGPGVEEVGGPGVNDPGLEPEERKP